MTPCKAAARVGRGWYSVIVVDSAQSEYLGLLCNIELNKKVMTPCRLHPIAYFRLSYNNIAKIRYLFSVLDFM